MQQATNFILEMFLLQQEIQFLFHYFIAKNYIVMEALINFLDAGFGLTGTAAEAGKGPTFKQFQDALFYLMRTIPVSVNQVASFERVDVCIPFAEIWSRLPWYRGTGEDIVDFANIIVSEHRTPSIQADAAKESNEAMRIVLSSAYGRSFGSSNPLGQIFNECVQRQIMWNAMIQAEVLVTLDFSTAVFDMNNKMASFRVDCESLAQRHPEVLLTHAHRVQSVNNLCFKPLANKYHLYLSQETLHVFCR